MDGKPAIHVISNAGRAGGIELLGPTTELTRENLLSGVHIHVVDTERLSCWHLSVPARSLLMNSIDLILLAGIEIEQCLRKRLPPVMLLRVQTAGEEIFRATKLRA
jgi:hypothetical protein